MTRRVLEAISDLDHGSGVTMLRIKTALRLSRLYFQHRTLINTLDRAVRNGYLRFNSDSGRYYQQNVGRLLTLRQNQTESVVDETVMPMMMAVPFVSSPANSRRSNSSTTPRREVQQTGREDVNIAVPQRRHRFDQSVVINIAKLPITDLTLSKNENVNNNTGKMQLPVTDESETQ